MKILNHRVSSDFVSICLAYLVIFLLIKMRIFTNKNEFVKILLKKSTHLK